VDLGRDVTVPITAAKAAIDDMESYLMKMSARGLNTVTPFNIFVHCKVLYFLHGTVGNSHRRTTRK